jgi:NAD(P)-dependent dehydrogenase (short-subunit alcohol dehydrogenase family)
MLDSRALPTRISRLTWSDGRHIKEMELTMTNVIVAVGAGSIGQAIARHVSAGKGVLLADLKRENADAAAKVLSDAGFEVTTAVVDVSSRDSVHALVATATALGNVTGVIHAAGVSPSQASPATILGVDPYGTALVLEEFGSVIAEGGAGVVIASQSGHRLPALTPEQNTALATTPTEALRALPMLQTDHVKHPLHAYQIAKRGGTPDEVGTVGALLMGPDGAFITGSDFLMDGGVTAPYRYGELAPN